MTCDEAKPSFGEARLPKIGGRYYWHKQHSGHEVMRVRLMGIRGGSGIVCLRAVGEDVSLHEALHANWVEMQFSEFWKRLGNGRLVPVEEIDDV